MQPRSKRHLPLPKRRREEIFEDPMQFLWAISYSDLLMVLMSFFVMYFEMSDMPENSPIKEIILTLKKDATAGGMGVAAAKPPPTATPGATLGEGGPKRELFKQLTSVLSGEKVSLRQFGEEMVAELPDDIFGVGHYNLDGRIKGELARILQLLTPYRDKISVTFVGHTDASAFARGAHTQVVDSNLVLSNLRAVRAVEIALQMGFDPARVFSEGASEHSRHTRSLSIRITERVKP
ncbi:flagellar motor protein MotB [Bdellovibrionota bacterium FG-1]